MNLRDTLSAPAPVAFLMIIMISVVIRYFAPLFIGNIFFVALIFVFVLTKRLDAVFLAVFLLLIEPPGYLFYDYGTYALPSLTLGGSERSIDYPELVILATVIKTIHTPRPYRSLLRPQIGVMVVSLIIALLTTLVFGISLVRLFRTIRFLLPYALLFSLPRLVKNEKDFYELFKCLSISVFIMFFAQLVDRIVGTPIGALLGENRFVRGRTAYDTIEYDALQGLVRSGYGFFTALIASISALCYLSRDKKTVALSSRVLYGVVAISFLSAILSATRGWIIAYVLLISTYMLINIRNAKRIFTVLIVFLLVFLSILSIPLIRNQMSAAIDRLETIELLLGGDETAGGTLRRLSERAPAVLRVYQDSPLFGFGFSNLYYDNVDWHVGHTSMLLNYGVFGYALFLMFLTITILKLVTYRKGIVAVRSRWMYLGGILAMLLIHYTSRGVFKFLVGYPDGFAICFLFTAMSYEVYREEGGSEN